MRMPPWSIDGRRHDDEVDVVDRHRAEDLADGLGHAEAAPRSRSRRRRRPVEQAVGAGDREQHADAVRAGPVRGTARVFGSSVGREVGTRCDRAPTDSCASSMRCRVMPAVACVALGGASDCAGARGVRLAGRASRCRPVVMSSILADGDAAECCNRRGTRGSDTLEPHGVHDHQSSHSCSRAGNPLPARDQGDAQRDAAGRRQAGHPVRRRGGRRGRPRPTCS